MSQLFVFISTFNLLVLPALSSAQDAVTQPTIEVTASRVPELTQTTLASVSVITRADIEKSNARDLLEVLRL
jgi:vitamin B12 transporter